MAAAGIMAPPGVTPSFGPDVPSQKASLFGVAITFTIVSFAFLVARIIVKTSGPRKLSWDDYLAAGGLLACIARMAITIVAVDQYGLGRHIWDVPPANFTYIRNLQWIQDMVYLFGIMLIKISILIVYITVFNPKKTFVKLCYGMMAVVIAYCVIFIFIYAFNCMPEYWSWHFTVDPTVQMKCIGIVQVIMAIGAVNLVTDLILLIMPIPQILKLQLRRRQKIGVLLVFLTGTFIVIVTIVRLVIVVDTTEEVDQPWTVTDEINWLTIELNIGLVCACLPALAPVYMKLSIPGSWATSVRSLFSRTFSTRSSRTGASGQFDGSSRKLSSRTGESLSMNRFDSTNGTETNVKTSEGDTDHIPEGRIGLRHTIEQHSTRRNDMV